VQITDFHKISALLSWEILKILPAAARTTQRLKSASFGQRRCPLNGNISGNKYAIGLLTVMMLVILRLCLGCHFLYEGVWKIVHADRFTAESYLAQAKGPLASYFYALIPDINGRQRLQIVTEPNGKKHINTYPIASRWNDYRRKLEDYLKPRDQNDQAAVAAHQRFQEAAEKTYHEFVKSLEAYFADNLAGIETYFASLDRFENGAETRQDAPFQKQRHWERMMQLRAEAAAWINELNAREETYKNALYELMDQDQREKFAAMRGNWKIWQWDRMEQINFAVTYGLTAIGLCLLLGLFTRLAALGGAAFMCFVVMTQPAWPTIFPPDPLGGHALIINKDFIEMIALLLIATTAVGRWGGLDFFVHRWFVRLFCKRA
jgi:uncharacterized membrane protein YphA (DoxX/SURF4 family)